MCNNRIPSYCEKRKAAFIHDLAKVFGNSEDLHPGPDTNPIWDGCLIATSHNLMYLHDASMMVELVEEVLAVPRTFIDMALACGGKASVIWIDKDR